MQFSPLRLLATIACILALPEAIQCCHPQKARRSVRLPEETCTKTTETPEAFGEHFTYEEQDDWKGFCHGKLQSPIDISTKNVMFAESSPVQFVNYGVARALTVKNNGHGFIVQGFFGHQTPFIQGGGLPTRYQLTQFHFHWSDSNVDGSEHAINGNKFAAELHLVHVKEGLTFSQAQQQCDGIAVVAVFYKLCPTDGALAPLEDALTKIRTEDAVYPVASFAPIKLLPADLGTFYRYYGSLTTPECSESVVWTVLTDKVCITQEQLELFRAIHSTTVRNVEPLNGRIVRFVES